MQALELEYEGKNLDMPLIEMVEKEEHWKLCQFIKNPHKDCYILTLDSLKVEAAVFYCGRNYKKCAIYQKLVKERKIK